MKKCILMLLALVMCFTCVCVHAEDAHEPVTLTIYPDNATYGANEAHDQLDQPDPDISGYHQS